MRVGTGALVLFALVLSACASPATPSTLPTPTSTPTPSASATASPSAGQERASATDALIAYFESANAAAGGSPLDDFRSRFSETCQACMSALQDFESAQARGLVADADRYLDWQIAEQRVDGASAVMTSTMNFAAVDLVDASGQVVEQIGAWNDVQFAWTLQRQDDDSWLVVQGQMLP